MSVQAAHRDSVWPAASQQRGPFPCFAARDLLECAAEPCRCIEGGVGGGLSPDDRFCLSVWERQPALMSLHEFLREGGEVSFRIMNRLSHLIQNLDISGAPFPFSPGSRKNSWKDWDGKTNKKKGVKKKRAGVWVNAMFVLMCNFLELPWLHPLCVFLWSAGHRAQRVSSGLHSLPGCFCVPVAVRVRDSAAQADAYTERIMADAENAAFSTETAGTYRWDGNCWFKLLSFFLRCPFF